MKKVLAAACLLLIPILIPQCISIQQWGLIRKWMAGWGSAELLVGVAWPFAANDDGMDKGLLLALDEINARGIRGKRIRLQMRDDQLDREVARKIAIDFATNPKMVATIGYYDDKFAVRASAIFEQAALLHIVAGANNTYMTTHGFRYLIRSVLSSERIGRKVAQLCMDRGYRNFAIIYEDGAFGEDLAYQTGIELDARSAHVVHQSSYVPGRVDFRETVDVLKEGGEDVILFLGLERESALFIKAARSMGLQVPIVGSFSDMPEMRAIAGRSLEGVMHFDLYDVNTPTPENQAFVAKFRRRFGADPDTYAAQGYDALWLLAKAYETTGSTDSLDLAYAIRAVGRYEGANGAYSFDVNGELADKNIFLRTYRGGKSVIIAVSKPTPPVSSPAR